MALQSPLTVQPYDYIADSNGRPLDKGRIYIGVANQDPEFYQIPVYLDAAMTKPIDQPIRTNDGFVDFAGSLSELYASAEVYSVKVLDKQGRKVLYKGDMTRKNLMSDALADLNQSIIDTQTAAQITLNAAVNSANTEVAQTVSLATAAIDTATTKSNKAATDADAAIKTLFENGGLPATPFATKALMEASELPDGAYAVVTNDEGSVNGLYLKKDGVFINSEYDLRRQLQKEMITVFESIDDRDNSTLPIGSYALIGDSSSEVSLDTPNLVIHKKTSEGLWESTTFNVERYVSKYVKQWIKEEDLPQNKYVATVSDPSDNSVILVEADGTVEVPVSRLHKSHVGEATLETKQGADNLFSVVDSMDNYAFTIKGSGAVEIPFLRTAGSEFTKRTTVTQDVFTIADRRGFKALYIDSDGVVNIPKLRSNIENSPTPDDSTTKKTSTKVTLHNSDAIMFLGDSYTESNYSLLNKSYVGILGNLLDYRVVNFGVSGDEALSVNRRLVFGTNYGTVSPYNMHAKYAVIALNTNDSLFLNHSLDYYKENVNRLVNSVKAFGMEPIVATEFTSSLYGLWAIQQIAREQGIRSINCNELRQEFIGFPKSPFNEGHPGTRTNGVFWIPMLKVLEKLPRPKNCIKIFRKRRHVPVAELGDLLYKTTLDRYELFKEINHTHKTLTESSLEHFEELDHSPKEYTAEWVTDEYYDCINGTPIPFEDYGLVEITVDGTAMSLESLLLNIDTDATVYVRNFVDPSSTINSRRQGWDGTTAAYQEVYKDPAGAWQEIGKLQTIESSGLKNVMYYDKIQLLLYKEGGFSLSNIEVEYEGGGKQDGKVHSNQKSIGDNLVSNPEFTDLSSWTLIGSPKVLVPIDAYQLPRKETDRTVAVDNVIEVTNDDQVQLSIENLKKGVSYRLEVWCRFFPKAYLDNSYYNLDPEQVIDRNGLTMQTDSEINEDTHDFRRLVLRYSGSDNVNNKATALVTEDFAHLMWRAVEFDIYIPEDPQTTNKLTINLSCPDGVIQIAKINLKEIF